MKKLLNEVSVYGTTIKVGDIFTHFGYGHNVKIDSIEFVEYRGETWHRVMASSNGHTFMTSARDIYESYDKA